MSTAVVDLIKVERERLGRVRPGRRPRVLHLINNFDIGGTERQAVELLKRLDPERFDVRLATLRNTGPLYQEISDIFPVVPEFPLTSFYNLNAARQAGRLRALMIADRIDILHAHDFYAGLIGAAAARLAGTRVIACQRHLKLSDRAVHGCGQRIIHRLAHRILVNSEAVREYIIKHFGAPQEKILIIHNGISLREASDSASSMRGKLCRELGVGPDANIVGSVARLQPVKGHRFLIEAAARVLSAQSNTHFVLVGDGPLRSEIEAQAAALGIRDHIHFLGDRTDVARLVTAFDLVALASFDEGLPNAVMEAMAAGVPVVATAVGGTTELIADGETGYLVPPSNAEAIAQTLSFALTNKGRSSRIAQRARRFIQSRYGMGRMVESVEELYGELMLERTNLTALT